MSRQQRRLRAEALAAQLAQLIVQKGGGSRIWRSCGDYQEASEDGLCEAITEALLALPEEMTWPQAGDHSGRSSDPRCDAGLPPS